MLRIKAIIFAIVLLFSVANVHAQSKGTLVFYVAKEGSKVIDAYSEFLRQAYGKLGYELSFKRVPSKRSLHDSNLGKSDGELIRALNIQKMFPNLVPVKAPLATIQITVYTKDKIFVPKGRDSLKPYKIGIIRGFTTTDKVTRGLNRHEVKSYDSLFKMLQIGRIDIALLLESEAIRFLKKNPQFEDIKPLKPAIISVPLLHFLHKKHMDLIPQIQPIMEKMIKEKVLEKLVAPYQN
ncbi:MAG: amino acid ABC transporter substrate-binding protein [Proteobacteria bacterium]|nr:amino acid ABC transporter substrate-binding protein [Pseudomonadota bacterium]